MYGHVHTLFLPPPFHLVICSDSVYFDHSIVCIDNDETMANDPSPMRTMTQPMCDPMCQ